ncbi:hypothetical protein QUF72_12795 [Desulfobacterales bacterium HSG2]|nr:hypothetical protein [Desulfobacterales bacterium HSG2]
MKQGPVLATDKGQATNIDIASIFSLCSFRLQSLNVRGYKEKIVAEADKQFAKLFYIGRGGFQQTNNLQNCFTLAEAVFSRQTVCKIVLHCK